MKSRGGSVGGVAVGVGLALLLAIGAVVVLSNPRHRAFYLEQLTGSPRGPEAAKAPDAAGFRLRAPAGFGGAPEIARTAAVAPGHRVPLPDASGRIRVPITDRVPSRLPFEGVPPGWTVWEFTGRATVELVRAERGVAVRLRSVRTSFALYRDVIVDLRTHPLLTWSWKVVRLPEDGDVRQRVSDDEAAQVYVIFPRWPSPLTASDVVGYVWDTRAPVGTHLVSPGADNVRLIVVQSGRTALATWQEQQRDVAVDYRALFGRPPPRVGQIALMIDSNDTRGEAEALFGELAFSRAPRERVESPTSMLR